MPTAFGFGLYFKCPINRSLPAWAQCFSILESSSSKWVSSSDLQMEVDHGVLQRAGILPRAVALCSSCELDGVAEDPAGFLTYCPECRSSFGAVILWQSLTLARGR